MTVNPSLSVGSQFQQVADAVSIGSVGLFQERVLEASFFWEAAI